MTTPIRLATIEHEGAARAAVVGDDEVALVRDLAPRAPDDVRTLIAEWERWREDIGEAAGRAGPRLAIDAVAWLAPVVPRKLLCVGANYHDHVAEMDGPAGLTTPPAPFPYTFLKPPTALTGSGRAVAHPAYGAKLDWEVELAVVIGDPSAAAGAQPLDAVFGYSILNDLSLRDFIPFPHALGLDALVSKGFDGAAPMGPWITAAADLGDPQELPIQLSVNGELLQDSTTAEMIFGVAELLAHYARVLSLEPGDVIATGTPAGVGAARRPPRFLSAGDRVQAHIGGLGTLETTIAPAPPGDPLPTTTEVSA